MTPLDFLLVVLLAAALHRLWNYDAVCTRPRALADKIPYLRKPLLCPACNAFWFGLLSIGIMQLSLDVFRVASVSLGGYLLMNFFPWVYQNISTWTKPKSPEQPKHTSTSGTAPTKAAMIPAAVAVAVPARTPDRTVVILTALSDFRSSYSVATAVLTQARAIGTVHPLWDVQVWVVYGAQDKGWEDMPDNVSLHKIVPRMNWVENQSDEQASGTLRNFLLLHLSKLKNPSIITHDLLFVSWYAVFARAIHMVGGLGNFTWFHVPHSLPSDRKGKLAHLTTLPIGKHYIAPVADGYNDKYAEYYDTTPARVFHIPNIKDPRFWGGMTTRVRKLVTLARLWDRDFVQIMPVCTTRLEAKGFSKLLQTLTYLKQHASVALVLCNPNAKGERSEKILAEAWSKVRAFGLEGDVWFTSDTLPETSTYGLDEAEVKGLMQDYGNIFIFPSMGEADSLVALEAKLCRQYTVVNEDVPTLAHDYDWLANFGTGTAIPQNVCSGVANHLLDMKSRFRTPQRILLKTRNLEGIGAKWGRLISTLG